jgi:CRP/FNR family transcriptional regulator
MRTPKIATLALYGETGRFSVPHRPTAISSAPVRRKPACCDASCRHADACDATRGGDPALVDMREVVERVGPFSDGDRLVQPDAPHRAAFAVLQGMAKTVGDGAVLAFHLPGELFALDIARGGRHGRSVMAVGKTWFCRFPHEAVDALCEDNDALARHLRLLRRREHTVTRHAAEGAAAARVRSFLLDLLDRRRRLDADTDAVPLPMSRDDIGSYLGMSSATVTRMLARFRDEGAIAIHPTGVDVIDEARLRR